MQLIDKEATLKLLQEHRDNEVSTGVIGVGIKAGYDAAMIAISNYATVIEERKHGHWIGKPIAGYGTVRCSVCKSKFTNNAGQWNYCPSCGATMDEEVQK